MEKKFLTPAELSERWSITQRTLAQWRWLGTGPRFVKIGGSIRYPIDAVEQLEAGVAA